MLVGLWRERSTATGRGFEQQLGWANLFVLASSLSLARALVSSGAADW
jgi:di/tricarboxylate transporter